MSEIILHHYPLSPFAEKTRVALGIKGLAWRSVIIPQIMPKPELMPLTGGYRKTPVMQIGADIYCDYSKDYCDVPGAGSKGTCKPLGKSGDACGVSGLAPCGPPLSCVNGQCAARQAIGSSCMDSDECQSGYCSSGKKCQAITANEWICGP